MKIKELELNFSNRCGANCFFCSPPHGCRNIPKMTMETFDKLEERLKEIEPARIQSSGDGEVFMNENYLYFLKRLRFLYPNTPIHCYNNFSMMTEARAMEIIENHLLDRIFVRIESLEPWVMKKASGLNMSTVFKNLKYFLINNKNIEVTVLYHNVNAYYDRCQKILKQSPCKWPYTQEEKESIKNEMADIKSYFEPYVNINDMRTQKFSVVNLSHCLWGERHAIEPRTDVGCLRIEELRNTLYVLPNGDITACPYDDYQDQMIHGNIFEESLPDILTGERRKEMFWKIEAGHFLGRYPCQNPLCCVFGNVNKYL